MFGLGIYEIAVILIICLVVIKPEELPDILRNLGKFIRKLKSFYNEIISMVDEVSHEVGLDDVQTIIGDDGKEYQVFSPIKEPSTKQVIEND